MKKSELKHGDVVVMRDGDTGTVCQCVKDGMILSMRDGNYGLVHWNEDLTNGGPSDIVQVIRVWNRISPGEKPKFEDLPFSEMNRIYQDRLEDIMNNRQGRMSFLGDNQQ